MVKNYVPKQGDICYMDFNPSKGHEQSGFRPCLILSINSFNNFTKMAIVCPITSNIKDFPTHFILKNTKKVKGSVLLEHLKSIDYEERNLKHVEKIPKNELTEINELIKVFFELN